MVTFNGINVVQSRFPNNEVDYISANRMEASRPYPFSEPAWDEFYLIFESNEDLFNLQVIKKWWDDVWPNNWARLVIEFFPYSQMDREMDGHLFSLKYVAQIINDMNFREVTICDPHSNVLAGLLNHCSIKYPVIDFIEEEEFMLDEDEKFPWDLFFYPDNGAAKKYSELIDSKYPYRFGNKKRNLKTGKIEKYEIIADKEDIEGKSILIIDDLVMGGRTFVEAAKALREMGAKEVDLYITHLMPQAREFYRTKASGLIDNIFTNDSLGLVPIFNIEEPIP